MFQMNTYKHLSVYYQTVYNGSLTKASATAASTSVPVFRTLMALTEAEIRAWWISPKRSENEGKTAGEVLMFGKPK